MELPVRDEEGRPYMAALFELRCPFGPIRDASLLLTIETLYCRRFPE
jgi:hypothetical protein